MFKNQSSFSSAPGKIDPQNNSSKVAEMPVHTMADDLQDPTGSIARANASQEKTIDRNLSQNLGEKQKSSPFLNPAGAPEFSPKKPEENIQKNPVLRTAATPDIHIDEDSNKGTVFAIIIVFCIILIAGAGTYYFLTTRKIDAPESSGDMIETSEIITDKDLESGIKEDFSKTKPNYLTLNTATTSQASFRELLSEKSEAVINSGATSPIEFVVVDAQNNPIGFSDFAKITGINLPANILENLSKDFSLFIINDSSVPGIALAITAIDTAELKINLLQDEPMLSSQLGAILLSEYEPSTAPFGDHIYQGQAVRYQNLISPKKLAVDYAVTETKLLFATTKITIESLIDTLSSKNTIRTENISQ